MIITGQLMLPDQDEAVRLAPGWLSVKDGIIESVHTGEIRKDADLGGNTALITPGFFDIHAHLPQFEAIGAHGRDLLAWLESVVFPAETRWGNPTYARSQAELSLRNMLAHGTVGCAAYATVHYAGADAALNVARRLGMRAAIGQVLMDSSNTPSELRRSAEQLIEETGSLLEQWPRFDTQGVMCRVSASVNPRFALSCSTGLLHQASELAHNSRALIQTHIAEMQGERAIACQMHEAESYADIYYTAGLLSENTLLGHGVWLDEAECDCIASSGSIIAHCPLANVFLSSGTMNRALWKDRRMRVGLGSDIGAGYEVSMVRNARAMIHAAFYTDSEPASVPHAWWQITEGNAALMGWQDAGVLREGAAADLLLVRPDARWLNAPDPLGYLMFAWDDRWIKCTLLEGNAVRE